MSMRAEAGTGPASSRALWGCWPSWPPMRALQGLARQALRLPWVAERLRFFQAWRAAPGKVGAILPSSRALARAITREIGPHTGPVLELGSGTGAFTRALRARGVPEYDLALVEMESAFVRQLRRDFPEAQVCHMDASRLADEPLFEERPAGAAVCGLPLLNMPLRTQVGILDGAFRHLRQGGAFYLFTYGPRCPVPRQALDRLGLRARKLETILLNVPPAHVWKLTRRRGLAGAGRRARTRQAATRSA